MDVLHERCAGVDVSKTDCKVAIRVPGKGVRPHREVRTFSAMTDDLLALRDWLVDNRITVVGMEATGAYWKPLYYLLEATDGIEPWLLNAQHMKAVPGRKTDVKDSQWICRLVEHGLVRPSFVPPREIRQLRDLTRYRTETVRDRARDVNRLNTFLEDAGIKLSTVVSDITGISARRMLDALVAGERDPEVLSDLALGAMRGKIPVLNRALAGHFTEHHAFVVDTMLTALDHAQERIESLGREIDRQLEPFRRQVELLVTIPGVGLAAAQVILAEIGTDMSRFPTAGHLASWAGMCPGNHESAGRRRRGTTRPGDVWLKGALGIVALSASRTKGTYLAGRYRRLIGRLGRNRTMVAIGHSVLIAAWHMLSTDTPYRDLGPEHFTERLGKARQTRRLVAQLAALGYDVDLQAKPTPTATNPG
ncbi:IS110 family transposase [Streptomyces sp. NRRL S-495]|uniref:IS110 family transposase n=1 Tax=Streptomyces sp. NRRL S-495 TaxID=1609133 RepID=UPI0005F8C413|nr:IS110 family transposase [Streptomyces sp. NRRL S-495]KJY30323.1 transposase [Streptomyces sp. NRRL S-495]